MAELITALIDIALGALAYRLALTNRAAIKAVTERVERHETALKKAGILDSDSH